MKFQKKSSYSRQAFNNTDNIQHVCLIERYAPRVKTTAANYCKGQYQVNCNRKAYRHEGYLLLDMGGSVRRAHTSSKGVDMGSTRTITTSDPVELSTIEHEEISLRLLKTEIVSKVNTTFNAFSSRKEKDAYDRLAITQGIITVDPMQFS